MRIMGEGTWCPEPDKEAAGCSGRTQPRPHPELAPLSPGWEAGDGHRASEGEARTGDPEAGAALLQAREESILATRGRLGQVEDRHRAARGGRHPQPAVPVQPCVQQEGHGGCARPISSVISAHKP